MLSISVLHLLGLYANPQAQYRFDHWTVDNGLPQNSVRDIVQTRDGYLWMTTFDGLVRFDGVRFTVFNKSNAPGLPSSRFISLYEDRQGDLWAVLENGGIVRRHQGRFTTYTQAQGVPEGVVPQFGEDAQGHVLLYDLVYIRQGLYWGPDVQVRVWRLSGERFQPAEDLRATYTGPRISAAEIPINLSYFRMIAGEVWLTTPERVVRLLKGGGAQVYSEQTGLPGKHPRLIASKQGIRQVLTRDGAGRFWLTELKSMQSQLVSQQEPEDFNSLSGFADSEGNVWFATNGNGLFRARRQMVTPLGKAQGLRNAEVYPLLESRDGSLWIGTTGAGVFQFKDGALRPYPIAQKKTEDFHGFTHSLYEDRAGQLYVNGSWRLSEERYLTQAWLKEMLSLKALSFWTMCQERTGAYWVGTEIGVMRIANGALTHFTTKDGLAGNDTKVIIEDGQGGLWLGSYGGITHYRDGKFTVWTEKDGLPGNTVRALSLDSDGTLWIGTYDSGLGRFKDGRFTRYTTKDGLFDNGVFQMLDDDFGWCWMSSNRGLYRVRKQELNDFADGKINAINCLAYNKSDGMPSTECNGGRWPAGIKTRDGQLWFPTMEGIAIVDPANVKANTQPPPVVIEDMRINNQLVADDAWQSAIRNPNSALRILPGQDNFEIAYTALSFINSEHLRFKYKLEGADEDWVDAGTRRTAYFSHLAPGDYNFRVIAANADGMWNEAGAHLRIQIVPPFHRTWWFLSLSVLGVAGTVFAAFRYRVRQLEERQVVQQTFARRLIESQEAERKRIAAELHDSLSQSLVIIKNRALMALQAPVKLERATAQLEEIAESSVSAIDEVREIAYALRPFHLDRLGLTKAIAAMVEKMAETHGLQATINLTPLDGLWPPEAEINLYRIVQESLNNIVKHAQATTCRITTRRLGRTLELEIADNGRGLANAERGTQRAESSATSHSGFGLLGMTERVRLLGGQWLIQSAPGAGTTITIKLSVPDKDTPPTGKQTDES